MSLVDFGPSDRHCLVYCGDDRCTCRRNPKYDIIPLWPHMKEVKTLEPEKLPDDLDLEQKIFQAANSDWTIPQYQELLKELWKAYCEMKERAGLQFLCDNCGNPLTEPGALLFTAPNADMSRKFHICISCQSAIADNLKMKMP